VAQTPPLRRCCRNTPQGGGWVCGRLKLALDKKGFCQIPFKPFFFKFARLKVIKTRLRSLIPGSKKCWRPTSRGRTDIGRRYEVGLTSVRLRLYTCAWFLHIGLRSAADLNPTSACQCWPKLRPMSVTNTSKYDVHCSARQSLRGYLTLIARR